MTLFGGIFLIIRYFFGTMLEMGPIHWVAPFNPWSENWKGRNLHLSAGVPPVFHLVVWFGSRMDEAPLQ